MKIAIYGTGAIGSTFALHLARVGHDVTCVARGERLAQLRASGLIVTDDGRRAAVSARERLDPAIPFDLVIVTVLAHKVDAVLPALRASAARTVLFMFNQFEPLARLRDALGAERVAFAFPAVIASIDDGVLTARVVTLGQRTLASAPQWADLFTQAGIPTDVEPEMQSWLRTHAVIIATLAALGVTARRRGAGLRFDEARAYARALREGLDLVEALGERILPPGMVLLRVLPLDAVATALFLLSRSGLVRALGVVGADEPRALVDAMLAAAPGALPALSAIRP